MTDSRGAIRAFIAFELPENVISSISRIQAELKSLRFKMRWVRPEGIHLTLKFLGDIDPGDTDGIGKAMQDTAGKYAPIPLEAKGIGAFPGVNRARVIWIGLSGRTDLLAALHRDLDEKLAALGFPLERRGFKGHLTLCRAKGRIDPKRLADAVRAFDGSQSAPFTVKSLVLFRSELKPGGAVYTKLSSASLKTT